MGKDNKRGEGRGVRFLHLLVGYNEDTCVTWPFARNHNGHGQFGLDGGVYRAHRYMCELANGPPPTPDHEAAHSCGNGHNACVNPKHLSWKTRSGNQQDRVAMGRILQGSRFKLTPEKVAEIRSLEGKVTNTELARRFGVSRGAIRMVHLRQTWPNGVREKPGTKAVRVPIAAT
jgi:hypothetical protein